DYVTSAEARELTRTYVNRRAAEGRRLLDPGRGIAGADNASAGKPRETEHAMIKPSAKRPVQLHVSWLALHPIVERGNNSAPSGIIVGIGHDHLHAFTPDPLQRLQGGCDLSIGLIKFGRDRMLREQDHRLFRIYPETLHDFVRLREVPAFNQI